MISFWHFLDPLEITSSLIKYIYTVWICGNYISSGITININVPNIVEMYSQSSTIHNNNIDKNGNIRSNGNNINVDDISLAQL